MAEPTQTGSSLGSSAPAAPVRQTSDLPARFENVRELARGGMGRVLVAFDRLNQREVAIKEALSSSEVTVKRFEREALLTAGLQHPGVVPVYEVARRATGEPYLVMRRVQGQSLGDAIAARPALTQRLSLLGRLVSVVETVAYAHRQNVVHRDLKPSNVLLGEFGDTVVIDWGLAKRIGESEPAAAAGDGQGDASLTRTGSVLGTLAYMSPEQLRGGAVDARSDVYALGAMLYELLSGKPPHGKDTGGAEPRRAAEPLATRMPEVPRELATVVAKAMAAEPSERYADAAALARDLEAFQTGRLVASHEYSIGQLLSRWMRRNAPVLAAVGVSAVVLAALGVVSVRRVLSERDRANREAAAAQRVSDFLTQIFHAVTPAEAKGRQVLATELLDRGSKNIEQTLADDPDLQARMLKTMGEAYGGLGSYPKQLELLQQSEKLRAAGHDELDPELLRTRSEIASSLYDNGKNAECEKLAREVIAAQTKALGPEHADTLVTLYTLGDVLRDTSHPFEAEKIHRQVYEARVHQLGSEARPTLLAYGRLADDLEDEGKFEESAALFKETIERRSRAFGPDDPDTLWAMNGLSNAYQKLGRQADAEKIDVELLETRKRILGPEHPMTLNSMLTLGNDLFDREDFAGAEKLYAQVQEIRTRVLGPEHLWTLSAGNNRANALVELGHLEEGEQMHRHILEIRKRVLGPDHAHVLLEIEALGDVLRREKRFDEARAAFNEAIAGRVRVFGPDDQGISGPYYGLAATDADEGKYDAALDHLKQSLDHHLSPQDQGHILIDPSFIPLRDRPRFKELTQGIKHPEYR